MAKYQLINCYVHAEQWDGSASSADNLIEHLKYAGISATLYPEQKVVGLSVKVAPHIMFPGYVIHKDDYLIKGSDGQYYVRSGKMFELLYEEVKRGSRQES